MKDNLPVCGRIRAYGLVIKDLSEDMAQHVY